MKRGWLSVFSITVALVGATVVFLQIAIMQRIPSSEDCADLWNRPSNRRPQEAVVGYSKVFIDGWDTKAGVHCNAMFFDRIGARWQTYTLWVADPDGVPRAHYTDIGGDRFGSGWFFEVSKPQRPNATISPDGRLIVD